MEVKSSPVSESPEINETASTESHSTSQKEVLPTENAVVQLAVGHGVGAVGEGSGQVSAETAVRRKRGRPRKCGISGTVCHLSEPPPKRPRGIPLGSGRIQFLTSIGGCGLETVGGSFTPHVLEIKAGQDIGTEISSLVLFPRAAIVFTANGTLSSVVLAHHGQTGGFVRYDGNFEILSLTGNFTFCKVDGTPRMDSQLSIVLAQPDGRVFGGAVTGCLIAANPIQIVVGTFKQSIRKKYRKSRFRGESSSLNVVNGGLGSALASIDNNDSIIPTPALSHTLPIRAEEGSIDAGNNQTESPTPLRVYCCENNLESSLPMSPENDIATPHTFRSKDAK